MFGGRQWQQSLPRDKRLQAPSKAAKLATHKGISRVERVQSKLFPQFGYWRPQPVQQRRSPRISAIRGFIQRRAVVTLTLLGGVALLLGGCAVAQGATGSIALGVVGLWLAGISLVGLLSGCATGSGSLGPGSPLTDSLPAAVPTPTPVVPVAVALRFAQQPTARVAGAQALTPITPAPQVEAIDASGNRVTSFTGSITVALGTTPPGAVLLGTTTRNAVAGVATFNDLQMSISGSYTLQASSSGLQSGTSSVSFVANPIPLAYATAKQYSTGTSPVSVSVGDFNNDGNLDLAVTNRDASTVSVLLGNGDGTFNAIQTLAVGATPYGVAVGDFNGDNKLDIVIASYGNSVSVLQGEGDGTFKTAQNIHHRRRQRRRLHRCRRLQLHQQQRVGAAGQRQRQLQGCADLRRGKEPV
ncbi:MAG: VCBS repeat-containing protein [Proteobacteria bacterium]|nr:VCBS repeat-containing protein [Pseudomonadota bacterium]